MMFADATLGQRVTALEKFVRRHEDRHAYLIKQLQDQVKATSEVFKNVLAPNPLSGFGDFGQNILQSAIKAIHVRSNYGPDIDLVDPFGPSTPNATMEALQPSLILDTDAGPIVVAPYGAPGPTQWGNVLAGLGIFGVVLAGLAGYGAYKLFLAKGR